MPKAKTKTNSRTSRAGLAKRKGFKFRWWMGVVIVVIIAVVGLAVLRFSQAGSTEAVAPQGPIYWLGDSLSTNLWRDGNLVGVLEGNGYNPAYVNANPGRSITSGGFPLFEGDTKGQSGMAAIEVDNKNVCPGAKIRSIIDYCANNSQRYNPIADAKTIVIFLGTNPELSKDSFVSLQDTMLNKLKAINPNARYIWVDIAAPGDIDKYVNQNTPDYTKQQLADIFVKEHERIKNNQRTIYGNSTNPITGALRYSVISQFRFIWGTQTNPLSEFPNITNQQDCHNFVEDGTHYNANGSTQLAIYLKDALKTPNFASRTTLGSATQPTCGFLPLPQAESSNSINDALPELTIALPSYGLFSGASNIYTQQDPQVFRGEPSASNTNLPPDKQCDPGYFKQGFRKGCVVTPDNPVTVISNQFARPVSTGKKQICVQGYTKDGQNSQVNLITTLQPLLAQPSVPVRDGSSTTDNLNFTSQLSRQCSHVFSGNSVKIDQLKFISAQNSSTVLLSVSVNEAQ